jgi:hypothetical protein
LESLLNKISLILSLITLNLVASNCDSFVEISGIRGSFDGELSKGTKLSLKDDLDLKKSANNFSASIRKGFKRHKFGFKLSKYKYSGKKRLNKDIVFNAEKIAKAQMLTNKLDIKWAKLTYRYSIADGVSAGLNLNGLRAKTYINSSKYSKNILIPSLAIDYEHDLTDNLKIKSKISLTPYGENKAMDSYAGIAIKLPSKRCSCLNIGYQVSNLKIKSNGFQSDLGYRGVYMGMRVGF